MSSTDSKLIKLQFRPGVNRQATSYAAEGQWFDSNRIRFRSGNPEAWRGWLQISTDTIRGKGRKIITWTDLYQNTEFAVGSESQLLLQRGGTYYDITPIRASTSLTGLFNVSSGSTIVVVSIPAHGIDAAGAGVVFTGTVTVGNNVYVSGVYYATTVLGANSFQITVSTAAVSTSLSAGYAHVDFILNPGASATTPGTGWGAGVWGHASGWGVATSTSAIALPMRIWSLDLWGSDLAAAPRNGQPYIWPSTPAVSARAYAINGAPTQVGSIIVSPEDRHMIALGANDVLTSIFDPLLVSWSDAENYNDWYPTVSNEAGDIRLAGGDKIVAGHRSRNQILIWTDNSLHGMSFSGPPFIFSFRQLGTNCGLIGPNAAVDLNGISYWMSAHNFHMYDGSVKYVPCNVQKYVFDRLDTTQADKVFAGSNQEQKEICWLYPSDDGTGEVDSYALLDLDDGVFSIGNIDFTGWADRGTFDTIITTNVSSLFFTHEVEGYYLANGQPMNAFIESAVMDIADGDDIMFIDRMLPDFSLMGTQAQVDTYIFIRTYPGQPYTMKGPFTITSATNKIDTRLRGRRAKFLFCTPTAKPDSYWELGNIEVNVQPDGKR
jgi:hypothetical protein